MLVLGKVETMGKPYVGWLRRRLTTFLGSL
jgi:hypothetical protein